MQKEVICFIIGFLFLSLFLLLPDNRRLQRKKHLNNILVSQKKKRFEDETNKVKQYVSNLIHFNNDFSAKEKFIKEVKISALVCVLIFIVSIQYGQPLVGIGLTVLMLLMPFYIRFANKKEYLQEYKNSFFDVINYLILYLSGGLNIQKALEETEALVPETDVIKNNLKMVINERKLSGVSGNTIIESLRLLNNDFDLDEIDNFIITLELAQKKGTEVTSSLQSQLTYIDNQNYLKAIGKIDNAAVKISMYKTVFGLVTCMALFIIPPIINAFSQMTAVGF